MNGITQPDKEEWEAMMRSITKVVLADVHKRVQPLLDRYSLSKLHIGYLKMLLVGPATLKELTQELCVDKANTTRAIVGLRESGLITDDREDDVSRKYNVFLTPEGKELALALSDKLDEAFGVYTRDISREEMHAMLLTFRKIQKNIETSE